LEKDQYKALKKLGVIEGKAPNVYISLNIAAAVDGRAQYTKNKAMDDKYYEDLIINYLQQFNNAKKSDLLDLLSSKLSDVLNDKQKDNKVRSLIRALQNKNMIERTDDNRRNGAWQLTQQD